MTNSCFNCGAKGEEFYGYVICDSCKSKLRLFADKTIKKYNSKKFADEIQRRLDFIEKDYIKKRIKLLYIQDKLN